MRQYFRIVEIKVTVFFYRTATLFFWNLERLFAEYHDEAAALWDCYERLLAIEEANVA